MSDAQQEAAPHRAAITLSDLEALIEGTYFAEDGGHAEEYVQDYMQREGMSREEAIRVSFWEIQGILAGRPVPGLDTL